MGTSESTCPDFLIPRQGKLLRHEWKCIPIQILASHRVTRLTFLSAAYRNKKETKSYVQITETLGVDNPSEILFVTDVYEEATAAEAAGTSPPPLTYSF